MTNSQLAIRKSKKMTGMKLLDISVQFFAMKLKMLCHLLVNFYLSIFSKSQKLKIYTILSQLDFLLQQDYALQIYIMKKGIYLYLLQKMQMDMMQLV